jgi:uncharacterized protein YndB with AHSA1/START domain
VADGNATITILRPLDDVWAVLTDPEKSPIWSAPTIEEHWLTPPPHGLGSRRRAVNRGFGRTQTNDAEVTAYEPKRSWTMTSVSGPRFVMTAEFEPVEGGTRVDFGFSLRLSAGLRLFEPIFMRVFMGQFRKGLARLKELMESGRL